MKLVIVEWVDSTLLGQRWVDSEELEHMTVNTCLTVGFVYRKDKEKIVLCQGHCKDDAGVVNVIAIPRNCVKSIKDLTYS